MFTSVRGVPCATWADRVHSTGMGRLGVRAGNAQHLRPWIARYENSLWELQASDLRRVRTRPYDRRGRSRSRDRLSYHPYAPEPRNRSRSRSGAHRSSVAREHYCSRDRGGIDSIGRGRRLPTGLVVLDHVRNILSQRTLRLPCIVRWRISQLANQCFSVRYFAGAKSLLGACGLGSS